MFLNKAVIAGNLTRDPEMKALPSGMQVVSFSVATNRQVKDKDTGQYKDVPDYHNVVFFGKRAEVIAKHFTKGSPIYVEGRNQTRSWDKDGQKMYRTEIIGDDFQFVGGKKDGGNTTTSSSRGNTAPPPEPPVMGLPDYPEEEINPEDIPF